MSLSRRNAFIVYTILLISSLVVVTIFKPIGNYVFEQILTLSIIVGIIIFLIIIPCSCSSKLSVSEVDNKYPNDIDVKIESESVQLHPSSNNTVPQSESFMVQLSNRTQPRPRLHYLDNLRSILTAFVVIYHVNLSFTGGAADVWWYTLAAYYHPFQMVFWIIFYVLQNYLMCLFFFISAYFIPSSYDRKGVYKFMADKLKRLGIPYLVSLFILNPTLNMFIIGILINDSYPDYILISGVSWFLGWLLIFNTLYIMMDKNVPTYIMNCPSLNKICLIGIGLGLIQLIIASLGFSLFIWMPITLGSLPFDILFFIAGIIAKRNNWLKQLVSMKVITIRILTIFCFIVVITLYVNLYIADIGYLMPKSTESETDCEGGDDWSNIPTEVSIFYVCLYIFGGFCCMIFSLFILQNVYIFCNYTNGFWKFLNESAYTVYLIHLWIVVIITWTYSKLLVAFRVQQFEFVFCNSTSKTHFDHNYLILLGWIYTLCLSFIIVWPLSWCIRRIPGFNKVL